MNIERIRKCKEAMLCLYFSRMLNCDVCQFKGRFTGAILHMVIVILVYVIDKPMTVYGARYPMMIRCNLSWTLSSVKHILQDVNRRVQNRTCKQPLMLFGCSRHFP